MSARIIDLVVGDSPDLYFAYDDCRIHRLSPSAYRDKYLLPEVIIPLFSPPYISNPGMRRRTASPP